MKQQHYIYGDVEILKDIRVKVHITEDESDTGIEHTYTLFDGKETYPYYSPDTYIVIFISYKNQLFFTDYLEDMERVSGFEKSILHYHIIKYNDDIYVHIEQNSLALTKATMTNNIIENNLSLYHKLVPFIKLKNVGISKSKMNEVF